MVIPTPDPLAAVSSSINATIKILEVTYQLKAVDEQTADLLSTTRHVDFMVQEAHRLRRLKAGLLNNSERTMIDTVISDTEDALRAVAKLVEPCRVDKNTKHSIKFGHRIMWVFRDNPSVRDKHQKLQVCHQSLTIAFNCLYSKDVVVIAPAPEGAIEERPPPYDPQLKELLNWQNRRKGRKSIGERDGPTSENRDLTKGSSNTIPVAGPLSPCLLAIPLQEDDGTPNLSTPIPELSSDSAVMPTPELQASVPRIDDRPLSRMTTPPESTSRSSQMNAHDSYSHDEIRSTPPPTHTNVPNDHIISTQNLPEIDSPPFATMIASYTFNNDEIRGSQIDPELRTHVTLSAWDQRPSSLTATASVTPSDNTSFPTPPLSPPAVPGGSRFNEGNEGAQGNDLGLKWFESSSHNNFDLQGPTEASNLKQHLPPAKFYSDIQLRSTYESDRLDALARAEDVMARENRAVSITQGSVKRGGRSWLAYHATRSDTGRGMDWNG